MTKTRVPTHTTPTSSRRRGTSSQRSSRTKLPAAHGVYPKSTRSKSGLGQFESSSL